MSSIRLTKEHNGQKAGTVISVPFGQGKVLIASGVGEYLDAKPKAKATPPVPATVSAPATPAPAKTDKTAEPAPPLKPEFPPTPTPHPGGHEKQKQK